MRVLAASLLAAVALAAPRPQDLDFDAIDALPDIPTSTAALGSVATNVVVPNAAAVIASIQADVSANPAPEATAPALPVSSGTVDKRDLAARAACDPLPTGTNTYNIDLDTADAFRADPTASALAVNAVTPDNYVQSFVNQKASIQNTLYFLGSSNLDAYDPSACSAKCDAKAGCKAFNLYIHRDPSLSAAPACPNPPPTVFIICALYSTEVRTSQLKNAGQTREQFQTAVTASNGYTSGRYWAVPGFAGPDVLGDAAINAPLDCNGKDTYMGVKIFQNTVFDPNYCAAACTAQNTYNTAHPPKDASGNPLPPKICNFFDTYIISINDEPQGQYCAMYTQYWDPSYAVNRIQYRGSDVYTKSFSFSYWNAQNKNLPTCNTPTAL